MRKPRSEFFGSDDQLAEEITYYAERLARAIIEGDTAKESAERSKIIELGDEQFRRISEDVIVSRLLGALGRRSGNRASVQSIIQQIHPTFKLEDIDTDRQLIYWLAESKRIGSGSN